MRIEAASNAKAKRSNAGAVISLVPESGVQREAAGKKFQIVQKHKTFAPHVLAVPVGSVVEFPNLDPFFHNVFSLFEGKRFDLGLYEGGGSHAVQFTRPGVSYIFCNIHPEMSAVVVAVDTPWYAVSDAAGEFSIPRVPPGRYRLSVWHERAVPAAGETYPLRLTIGSEMTVLAPIRLIDAGHVQLPHKNKYGQDYERPSPGYR